MDLKKFEALTFDCYGTLIDWEAGILSVLGPWRDRHGIARSDEELLAQYGEIEARLERGPYRSYKDILAGVMTEFAGSCGVALTSDERAALAVSLPDWPPFPDSVEALASLKRGYRLGILSNVDRDLFEHSARTLGNPFDFVVTAEDVGSYKPSQENFERVIGAAGVAKERILHVAQSLFHDIAPCNHLGVSCVWVNRRGDKAGSGATHPAAAKPDLEVPDLGSLAQLVAGE